MGPSPYRPSKSLKELASILILLHLTPHTSPHLTSPHLTSPHLTSPHLTSPHLTSPHLTPPHPTPPHPTPPHPTPAMHYNFLNSCKIQVDAEGNMERQEKAESGIFIYIYFLSFLFVLL